jgi:hypothetical protein
VIALLAGCRSAEPPPLPPTANRATYDEMWADLRAPRSATDGQGALRKVDGPDEVRAGEPISLRAELEVGPGGIAVGGAIVVTPSPFWGWSGQVALTAPDGVTLDARALDGLTAATVSGRALRPGEIVGIRYDGPADRFAERSPALWVGVDGDGDGTRATLPDPVEVRVLPGPAATLIVTVPSAVEPGQPVLVRIAAVDAVGNGPAPLSGPVTVDRFGSATMTDGLATLAIQPPEGVYRLQVQGPDGLGGISNPLVVRAGAAPILWADLQIHTALSDGTGDPADVYAYARDVAGLDVAAITDHDHWGMQPLDRRPDLVGRIRDATAQAYAPGRFVTVDGYEWTNWAYGHRHILWFDGPGDWRSSLDERWDTPAELAAGLRGREALIVRHHPAGGPVAIDWSWPVDPELEPVVEIASVHGQSESASLPGAIYDAVPSAFVDQQLAGGARFGLIGSTDGHDGHPGLSQLAGGQGGLAALEGATADRESVYRTLRQRRVYATNGPRIILRVDVDGHPMGSAVEARGTWTVDARVIGTAPLDHLELVRSAAASPEVVGSWTGHGELVAHATWSIEPTPGDLVYVRVVQTDGGLAWSSPVTMER